MGDVDFNQSSVYLLNKYFIQPVLSLNTSVTNIGSTVSGFSSTVTSLNNFSTVLSNASAITSLNASIINLNTSLNNAIDAVNSTTLSIGGTNGTLSQSYAGALTSGTLNLATAITTGNINIGASNASNKVNIGGLRIGANAINAGTDANFQIATTNINTSISIGSSQTSGTLNIGNSNIRSGPINLANGTGSICSVNILNSGGATTGGSVNIANGTLQTTEVNIASGTGTGAVTIGNTNNTVNINGTLVMGTGKNITLQNAATGFVAPTTNQLGGFVSATYSGGTGNFTTSVAKVYGTITLTQQGYYLFVANCINYNSATANPFADVTIFNVNDSVYVAYVTSQQSTTSSTTAYSLSGFYRVTSSASKIFQLKVQITFTGGTATATGDVFNYHAIRIA